MTAITLLTSEIDLNMSSSMLLNVFYTTLQWISFPYIFNFIVYVRLLEIDINLARHKFNWSTSIWILLIVLA
jgi:hypothetical protein